MAMLGRKGNPLLQVWPAPREDGAASCHQFLNDASNYYTIVLLQVGRAGRDGKEASCHLFLDDADFLRLRSLAHSDGVDAAAIASFLRAVFEEEDLPEVDAQIYTYSSSCQVLDRGQSESSAGSCSAARPPPPAGAAWI